MSLAAPTAELDLICLKTDDGIKPLNIDWLTVLVKRLESTMSERHVCAICGRNDHSGSIEHAHITNKGMGGRGKHAPKGWDDTVLLCAGTGGNTDPKSCHGMQHAGHLEIKNIEGAVWFCPDARGSMLLRARGVKCHAACWSLAAYRDITDADMVVG